MSSARTQEEDATAAAARVRELRSRTGLTQEQLAARLGVSFATVNRWENGRSGMSPAVRRRFGDLERETAAQRTPPGAPPVPFSSFVGREPEITALTSLLPGSRLTSLVGPGGSGKTRLILEVLRRRPAGAPRVVFVAMDLGMDLVGDPALASARVASALGIRDQPGVPAAAAVTQALASQPALLGSTWPARSTSRGSKWSPRDRPVTILLGQIAAKGLLSYFFPPLVPRSEQIQKLR